MFKKASVVLGAACLVLGLSATAEASTTIAIATLAPAGSPWATAFTQFADDVKNDTGGDVILDFRYGYADEAQMVGDIRSGQLQGGAVTATGLGQINKDVGIFQTPGLFANWGKLDAARDKMKSYFDGKFAEQGFTILGWGDVGAAKMMSVGFDIKVPNDLQGKGCYFLPGDPIGPTLFAKIGGITPKQASVAEILPGLANGTITVVDAPPLAAEQLQWAGKITNINTMTVGFGIGAIIVKTTSIPADKLQILKDKGAETGKKLTASIRRADANAFARLKSRKTAYDPTDDEKTQWKNLMKDVRAQLRGSVFTASVFDQIVGYAK